MGENLVLSILILANNRASAALSLLSTQAMTMQQALTKGALIVGAAIVGAGVAAVDLATGFDQQMHKILALTGISQTQMENYETSLLQMAPALDQTPTALAKGLYYVISAGYQGSEALQILSYSAKAAAAGMTSMDEVSDVLTSAMNTFKTQGVSAGHAIDDIMAAITYGKIQLTTLATGFSFVGVQAANAGFNIDETSAAVSALSQVAGNRAGRRTMMDLSNLMRQLGMRDIAPVVKGLKLTSDQFNLLQYAGMSFEDKVKYIAKAVGLTATSLDQMRAAAHGNIDVFQQMAYAHMKSAGAFLKLVGGSAAALPAMMLLQDNFKSYDQILLKMGGDGATTAQAFDKIRESTGQKMNMVKVAIESILTVLGLQLLPVVNRVLDAVYKFGQGLLNLLTNVTSSKQALTNLKNAIQGIAVVVGVILTPSLIGAAIAAAPLVLAITGIIAAGIILGPKIAALVDHFGGWGNIVKTVVDKFNQLKPIILAVAGVITAVFLPAIIQASVAMVTKFIASLIDSVLWTTIIIGKLILYNIQLVITAVEELAAAWPILLIIAGVAALIAIVVLMVTHWKQVVAVLQHVGEWFASVGKAIWGFLTNLAGSIGAGAKAVGLAIVNGILDGLKAIGEGLATFGQWLYNHNYYVKDVVDGIVKFFTLAKIGVTAAVTAIKNFLAAAWAVIKSAANGAWSLVKTYIVQPIQQALGVVQGIATSIENALQTAWNAVVGAVKTAWTNFSNALKTAWDVGTAIYNAVVRPITDAIGALIKDALNWGVNLIHQFGQGIANAAGWLGNQAHNALSAVTGWLGFHSPAPNVPESAYWGSNLVKMFAADMQRALPMVKSAAQKVMQAAGLGGSGTPGAVGGGMVGGAGGGLGSQIGAALTSAIGSLAGVAGGGGGASTHYHNWAGAFPNATSTDQITAALNEAFGQRERTNYLKGRRAGMGGGLRAGI